VLLAVNASVHSHGLSSPILDVTVCHECGNERQYFGVIFSTENQYLQIIVVKLSVMLLFEL